MTKELTFFDDALHDFGQIFKIRFTKTSMLFTLSFGRGVRGEGYVIIKSVIDCRSSTQLCTRIN